MNLRRNHDQYIGRNMVLFLITCGLIFLYYKVFKLMIFLIVSYFLMINNINFMKYLKESLNWCNECFYDSNKNLCYNFINL